MQTYKINLKDKKQQQFNALYRTTKSKNNTELEHTHNNEALRKKILISWALHKFQFYEWESFITFGRTDFNEWLNRIKCIFFFKNEILIYSDQRRESLLSMNIIYIKWRNALFYNRFRSYISIILNGNPDGNHENRFWKTKKNKMVHKVAHFDEFSEKHSNSYWWSFLIINWRMATNSAMAMARLIICNSNGSFVSPNQRQIFIHQTFCQQMTHSIH